VLEQIWTVATFFRLKMKKIGKKEASVNRVTIWFQDFTTLGGITQVSDFFLI